MKYENGYHKKVNKKAMADVDKEVLAGFLKDQVKYAGKLFFWGWGSLLLNVPDCVTSVHYVLYVPVNPCENINISDN